MSTRLDASYPATAASVRDIRRDVVAIAGDCGFERSRLADVRLAVSEAATNAVVHAYRGVGGQIRALVNVTREELVVVIADRGPGMIPRTDSPGLGLGLPTITTVSDRLEVVSEGEGTELHIAFRRPR